MLLETSGNADLNRPPRPADCGLGITLSQEQHPHTALASVGSGSDWPTTRACQMLHRRTWQTSRKPSLE